MRKSRFLKRMAPVVILFVLSLTACDKVKDFVSSYSGTAKGRPKEGSLAEVFPMLAKIEQRQGAYLSDRNPVRLKGDLFRDESSEARPLTIGRFVFDKGLCVSSGSEIRYALDGDYRTFYALVGHHSDFPEYEGSITFEVYVDGQRKFKSEELKADPGDIEEVAIDVSGAKELVLTVKDSGDATDFAVWAAARIVK